MQVPVVPLLWTCAKLQFTHYIKNNSTLLLTKSIPNRAEIRLRFKIFMKISNLVTMLDDYVRKCIEIWFSMKQRYNTYQAENFDGADSFFCWIHMFFFYLLLKRLFWMKSLLFYVYLLLLLTIQNYFLLNIAFTLKMIKHLLIFKTEGIEALAFHLSGLWIELGSV